MGQIVSSEMASSYMFAKENKYSMQINSIWEKQSSTKGT